VKAPVCTANGTVYVGGLELLFSSP